MVIGIALGMTTVTMITMVQGVTMAMTIGTAAAVLHLMKIHIVHTTAHTTAQTIAQTIPRTDNLRFIWLGGLRSPMAR